MKAAVYRRFGGPEVVTIEDVPRPRMGDRDVLIAVRASTVSMADYRARSRDIPRGLRTLSSLTLGWRRPRVPILGMDLAGVVVAVGPLVTTFAPGDEVFAMLGSHFGGHAEYAVVSESSTVALAPRGMTFEDTASLVFGGFTALSFLARRPLRAGEKVLVNGASGAVGSAMVQLAAIAGAEVTAVCSERHHALVRSLGAAHVIDYAVEDFTASDKNYDVIVDCAGRSPFARLAPRVRDGGALLLVVTDLAGLIKDTGSRNHSRIQVVTKGTKSGRAELEQLAALAESGSLVPVRDATFQFGEIVDAHRLVAAGGKAGSVVVTGIGDLQSSASTIQGSVLAAVGKDKS
jgi:NADPH:quinone reductase-like Zn-dependent oxidoreductase